VKLGNKNSREAGNKKWQATYIAPLQPPTLATFRSWGSSAGAGRGRPAGANIRRIIIHCSSKSNFTSLQDLFKGWQQVRIYFLVGNKKIDLS
jgi:hypothetical protein